MTVVLVVEDNPVNRDVIGRRASRRGFSVFFAEDGPEGVLAAATQRPDIILMDINLGDMDGYEATRLILADPRSAAIPVIAVTANAFETDRQQALAAGCVDFDTKPINFERLIGNCLPGRR